MPKRHHDNNLDEPDEKKSLTLPDIHKHLNSIECGEILTDLSGNKWKLGKRIGVGGFGVIHEVSNAKNVKSKDYVAKIESHGSGPLFSEINCYLRIGKEETIDEWKKSKKLNCLGMPNYVASGSHTYKQNKFRFLIIPRFKKDLELILREVKTFNLKTVLLISSQILLTLEYIHSKGYIHSDIKASNIMLKENEVKSRKKSLNYSKSPVSDSKYCSLFRKCKTRKLLAQTAITPKRYYTRNSNKIDYNEDTTSSNKDEPQLVDDESRKNPTAHQQLYLLDFGLSSKYKLSTGEHKKFEDQRKAHAGTLLFCSRDAHKGITSRRSDLESLAFNMVYWLTGSLPWMNDLEDPELVQRKKRHSFNDIMGFLCFCTPNPPSILTDFFQYINKLGAEDEPDYSKCQKIIKRTLEEQGYCDNKFDFENLEGWKLVREKVRLKIKVSEFKRPPLLSNMPIKPVLRKKIRKKSKHETAALKWWKMLSNPEVLLKKGRERKIVREISPQTINLNNIKELNPTPTMLEVFQRYQERKGLSPSGDNLDLDGAPEGYTPAMVLVWKRMNEEKSLQEIKPLKRRKKTKINGGITSIATRKTGRITRRRII